MPETLERLKGQLEHLSKEDKLELAHFLLVSIEPEEVVEEQAQLWQTWVEKGPQGPIEQEELAQADRGEGVDGWQFLADLRRS